MDLEKNSKEKLDNERELKGKSVINFIFTAAVIIISVSGSLLGIKFHTSQAVVCIGIMYLISLACILTTWITVAIYNRKQ